MMLAANIKRAPAPGSSMVSCFMSGRAAPTKSFASTEIVSMLYCFSLFLAEAFSFSRVWQDYYLVRADSHRYFSQTFLIGYRSSSIIEEIKKLCASRSLSGYAYFFFDSRNSDEALLRYKNLLRSLLAQAAFCCGGIPAVLLDMYHAHGKGRQDPSISSLCEALQRVIEGFDHFYIMIDSLDECKDRLELLQFIKSLSNSNVDKLHLLLTSRPEPEIVDRLSLLAHVHPIQIQGSAVHRDIAAFLDERLSLISGWNEEIISLVGATLIDGADGM